MAGWAGGSWREDFQATRASARRFSGQNGPGGQMSDETSIRFCAKGARPACQGQWTEKPSIAKRAQRSMQRDRSGGGGRTDAPPRPRRLAVTPCMTDMISPCTKYIAGGVAQSVVASRRRASPQRHAAKASVARAAVALDLVCKLNRVACSLGRRQCARMTHRFARAAPSP